MTFKRHYGLVAHFPYIIDSFATARRESIGAEKLRFSNKYFKYIRVSITLTRSIRCYETDVSCPCFSKSLRKFKFVDTHIYVLKLCCFGKLPFMEDCSICYRSSKSDVCRSRTTERRFHCLLIIWFFIL